MFFAIIHGILVDPDSGNVRMGAVWWCGLIDMNSADDREEIDRMHKNLPSGARLDMQPCNLSIPCEGLPFGHVSELIG